MVQIHAPLSGPASAARGGGSPYDVGGELLSEPFDFALRRREARFGASSGGASVVGGVESATAAGAGGGGGGGSDAGGVGGGGGGATLGAGGGGAGAGGAAVDGPWAGLGVIGTNSPGLHVCGCRSTEGSFTKRSACPHDRQMRVPIDSSPPRRSESSPRPMVPVLRSFAQTKSLDPQLLHKGGTELHPLTVRRRALDYKEFRRGGRRPPVGPHRSARIDETAK